MLFKDLSELFDRLRQTSGKNAKIDLIADWIKAQPEGADKLIALVWLTGRPFIRRSDKRLNVAESAVINAIKIACFTDADKVKDSYRETGHLGVTAETMLTGLGQKPLTEPAPVTVGDVYTMLNGLAAVSGAASTAYRSGEIAAMLKKAKPVEAKYIVSIILESWPTGVGVGDAITESAIAKATGEQPDDVSLAHVLTADIMQAYEAARKHTIKDVKLQYFAPFVPALAESDGTIEEIIKKYGSDLMYDFKYDGFRVVAHLQGHETLAPTVKLYSRNLEDVTEKFPDVVAAMKLAFPDNDVIVDGEVIAVNAQGRPLPFQNISTRITRRSGDNNGVRVQYRLFDLLKIDDRDMSECPLKDRHTTLHTTLKQSDAIQMATYLVMTTDNPHYIKEAFNASVEEGNEGLIAKNLNMPYMFGDRCWIKIKGILDSIDCAVIGASWGTGKRKGVFGTFEIGILNPENNELLSLGNVGTGFSDQDLKDLTEQLKPHIAAESGTSVRFNKNPVTMVIACEEIQKSPKNSSSYGLRFPRKVGTRTDKGADEIMRIDVMYNGQKRHD